MLTARRCTCQRSERGMQSQERAGGARNWCDARGRFRPKSLSAYRAGVGSSGRDRAVALAPWSPAHCSPTCRRREKGNKVVNVFLCEGRLNVFVMGSALGTRIDSAELRPSPLAFLADPR
jgi:hypothetical protein